MSRPPAWRRERGTYPFVSAHETRFGDMDVLGHLNNVAYAALFENARVRFNRSLEARKDRLPGERWLIAAVAISYLAEGFFPDEVEIAGGIGEVGTKSWRIDQAMFQRGTCIATCDTVIVYSGRDGSKPLPPSLVGQLEARRIAAVG